jgi:hypothetical protein
MRAILSHLRADPSLSDLARTSVVSRLRAWFSFEHWKKPARWQTTHEEVERALAGLLLPLTTNVRGASWDLLRDFKVTFMLRGAPHSGVFYLTYAPQPGRLEVYHSGAGWMRPEVLPKEIRTHLDRALPAAFYRRIDSEFGLGSRHYWEGVSPRALRRFTPAGP